jgi:hypothetical protein
MSEWQICWHDDLFNVMDGNGFESVKSFDEMHGRSRFVSCVAIGAGLPKHVISLSLGWDPFPVMHSSRW